MAHKIRAVDRESLRQRSAEGDGGTGFARSLVIADDTVVSRSPRAAFHPLEEGQGGVLLHVDSGAYHGLNRVGALIWEILEQPLALRALVDGLRSRFEDPPAAMEDEVRAFLRDLHARDLIDLSEVPAA